MRSHAATHNAVSENRGPFRRADIMNASEVQSLIEAGLPGAQVRVSSPDDTHFEAVIVAPQFEGKRTLQRHQLVYGTLGARMGREIHALSMQVLSPQEASSGG
jgi:acid stress-induced BolA-like protein IbaG/YrbA